MHFYDFNIGDYAKKTPHLTNEEDLAYRRALDMYYDTEQPLPITHGLASLSRRLRVSELALKNVVEEFFPDGRNKHADEKIAEYHAFLNRQKANGSKGGRPKVSQNNPVVSQNNPSPSQPLTTKPLTTNQEKPSSSPKGSRYPQDAILSAKWGNIALELRADFDNDDVRIEHEAFKDYWSAKPGKDGVKLDWLATWRNWCRNSKRKGNAT